MTVSTTDSQIPYTGDGSSVNFAFPYYFLQNTDVQVYINGSLQVGGYTVTGAGNQAGGNVSFSTPPVAGAQIVLSRSPDTLQSTHLPPNDPFPATAVEQALDKLTMLIQNLMSKASRALTLPLYEQVSGALTSATARASKLLGFDVNGNVTYVPIPASVGAGNLTDEVGLGGTPGFAAGVDFTPNVSTSLLLSQAYGSKSNILVFFDASFQAPDQYSLTGSTLTFNSPIPSGVSKVYVRGGTTLSLSQPALNSVGNPQMADGAINDRTVATPATPSAGVQASKLAFLQSGASAQWRSVMDKLQDVVSVLDFMTQAQIADVRSGAATLDVTAACTAALATGKSVFFPAGTYKVSPIAAALPGTEPNRTSAWLLTSGQRVFGVGRQSRLLWGTPATRQFFFKAANCTNVELDSLFFDGGYGAFVVDPTADGSVDGTTVRNCFFANQLLDVLGGVQFPINSASKYHKNMTVSGCTTDGPSYHSILFTNCYNAKAIGNTFRNVTNGFCIDSSQGSRNVTIANNTADNVLYGFKVESSDTGAVNPPQWESHEVSITGNVVRGINAYGILLNSAADNIAVANNVLTGFSQYGINLDQAAGVSYNGTVAVIGNVIQAAVGSVNALGIRDYITNGSAAHTFVGNVITNVLNGFDVARPNVNITGGEIVASASAIVLEASQPLDGVNISGVAMVAATGVNVNGNTFAARRVNISNNNINFTTAGIYSQANAQLFNVSDNVINSAAPTLGGVILTNPTNCQVSGNLINMNSGVLNSIATSGATTACIITNNISNAPLSIAGAAGGTVTSGNITSAAYVA